MQSNNHLILAFGMRRSGTSWLGKILDSHPDTLYRHEPDSLVKLAKVPFFPTEALDQQAQDSVREYVDNIDKIKAATVCAKLPFFSKNYYSSFRFALYKINALIAKVFIKHLNSQVPVFNFIGKSKRNEARLVWKSIESVPRLGELAKACPEAKIVLIVRHPCGFIASFLKGQAQGHMPVTAANNVDKVIWERQLKWEQAKAYGLTMEKILSMSQIQVLAWEWLICNEKAISDLKDNANALVVRYEDLCQSPEQEAKKLFAHCDLSWNEQSDAFVSKSTQQKGDSAYFSVFKDPSVTANKWRETLSQEDIDTVKEIVSQSPAGKLFLDLF